MKKIETNLPEIKLIGISARTNNKNEMDPTLAKISPTAQKFFQQGLPSKIANRKNPGITYCAYTNYESDYSGDYTYFIGEEVSTYDEVPDGCTTLMIPIQSYTKFTTESGPMPEIVINAWLNIWQMTPQDFNGQRNYRTDFELYDERAVDPKNTILDIYIGIHKE